MGSGTRGTNRLPGIMKQPKDGRAPGKPLGGQRQAMANQKQWNYWGERKFWDKLPLILLTYVWNPHICSIRGCWVYWHYLFIYFLSSWFVGHIHENLVTASYKTKNETHLNVSHFVWNIKWFSLFVIATYMWCFIRKKPKQFLLRIVYNLKLFPSVCRVAVGRIK